MLSPRRRRVSIARSARALVTPSLICERFHRSLGRIGRERHDRAHPRISAQPPQRGRTPCLVVDLDVVRENYHSFAKALPDSRVFYAVKANPAPEVLSLLAATGLLLRHRLGRRDRDGARRRRHAGPHLLRQHHQEGARHRARLRARRARCSRSTARPRSRRSPAPRRAPGVLPHPVRLRRRRMAAVAQVRLRPGDGGRRARTRPPARPRALRHLVPCRLAAAQRRRPGTGRWRSAAAVFRDCAERGIDARPWSISAAASRPSTSRTCRPVECLRPVDLPGAAQAFRQPIPETIIEPGRGMVGNAGVIEAEVVLVSRKSDERRGALGLSRHRQVRRSRRDHGRVDPLSDPHPA